MRTFFLLFLAWRLVYSDTYMFTEVKLQTLMAEARDLNPFLDDLLNSIAADFNRIDRRVKPIMGPLKSRERTISKLRDEKGLDLLEIHDLSRGSLIFLNMEDMYAAIEKFRNIKFIKITKINDKFAKNSFYKDINMNFFFWNSTGFNSDQNGLFHLILEVQFHLCHFYHAKHIDDPVYHVRRLKPEDNSIMYPNTFQKEVDQLFLNSTFQKELFRVEFVQFIRKYFSFLSCQNLNEVYCEDYYTGIMSILSEISKKLYTKAWKNYESGKTCNLDVLPSKIEDLQDYI